ncbi:tetratricopeptide repeat protein [Candidatus Woesearchaeota archaeon]|nr:tetratricopeptide repeat protein [Candidatus Woesearchaeota archaeon]
MTIDTTYFNRDGDDFPLDRLLGLGGIVTREMSNLRARHPEIGSVMDMEKIRLIFEWLIPSPDSIREVRRHGSWSRQSFHYEENQMLPTNSIVRPVTNCMGFALLTTLMARNEGMEANVAGVYCDEKGDQTSHACSFVHLNKGMLVDPSHYKYNKSGSFDAPHAVFSVIDDRGVYYAILAGYYRAVGDAKRENQCYLRVLETNPDELDAGYNLGISKYDKGKFHEALEYFGRYIQIYSESISTLAMMADTCYVLGKKARAVELYRRAISVQARKFKAVLEEGDWKTYETAVPERAEVMRGIATILIEQRRTADAFVCLLDSVEQEPKNAAALFDMGTCYAIRGDLDTAVEYLNGAFELANKDDDVKGWIDWFKGIVDGKISRRGEAIVFR